jgi:hypothetical protein
MTLRQYKKKVRRFFGRRNVEFRKYNGSLWMRHRWSKAYSDAYGWIVDEALPGIFVNPKHEDK